MNHFIGIDLGTTHSLIGVWKDEKVQLIPNSLGKFLTPSAVSIDIDDTLLVGQIAFERLVSHANYSATEFKRFMGSNKRYQLGSKSFSPEDLSALVLKQLKQDAEEFLGEAVTEAVISVPAYFNNRQRRATQRAAELAGLKVERLINEPSAAALAFGLGTNKLELNDESLTYLVLDLGGGTFDVSLLEIFNGMFEIRASSGDNYLGGNDFTRVIVDDFCNQYSIKHDHLSGDDKAALFANADIVKRALSDTDIRNNDAEQFQVLVNGQQYTYDITPTKFATLTDALISRVRHPIIRTMNDADMLASQLSGVILVGGASRMPVFRSGIAKVIGLTPSSEYDPDSAIAAGACIQSGLKARDASLRDIVMVDVCPYTLGVEVNGEYNETEFLPVIERNQAIPVSETRSLYTAYPDQKSVSIKVFQGESFKPSNNVFLGELLMKIEPTDNSQELLLTYTYDINGVLEVEAKTVATGQKQVLYINDGDNELTDAQIKARFIELEALKILPRDQAENTAVVAKLESLFEQSLGEQREQYGEYLRMFEAVLKSNDKSKVDARREEVIEFIDYKPYYH